VSMAGVQNDSGVMGQVDSPSTQHVGCTDRPLSSCLFDFLFFFLKRSSGNSCSNVTIGDFMTERDVVCRPVLKC